MAIGALVALAQYLRTRGKAHRALFDASNLALSAGAAGLVFEHLAGLDRSGALQLLAALAAGLAYVVVNIGLLCAAMGLSEARSPLAIWQERFHWARYHYLAFGTLGLLSATAYAQLGAASLVAFALPPALLTLSMRDALARFRPAPREDTAGRARDLRPPEVARRSPAGKPVPPAIQALPQPE